MLCRATLASFPPKVRTEAIPLSHLRRKCWLKTWHSFCERSQQSNDPEIYVFIGEEQFEFKLSKMIACDRSSYFRRACQASPEEAPRGHFHFKRFTVDGFQAVWDYLYQDILKIPQHFSIATMLDIWKIAGHLELHDLHRVYMDALLEYAKVYAAQKAALQIRVAYRGH